MHPHCFQEIVHMWKSGNSDFQSLTEPVSFYMVCNTILAITLHVILNSQGLLTNKLHKILLPLIILSHVLTKGCYLCFFPCFLYENCLGWGIGNPVPLWLWSWCWCADCSYLLVLLVEMLLSGGWFLVLVRAIMMVYTHCHSNLHNLLNCNSMVVSIGDYRTG